MNLKKAGTYLLLALLVVFVVNSPGEAAKIVKITGEKAGEWFSAASDAFTTFLGSLF